MSRLLTEKYEIKKLMDCYFGFTPFLRSLEEYSQKGCLCFSLNSFIGMSFSGYYEEDEEW